MSVQIFFLGTAGDHSVVSKQIRLSGGIVIKTENKQYHIDPGPGTLLAAKASDISLRDTTAILVSHNHLTHCNDINAVIDAMTHSGFDKHGVLISNETLVNGAEGYQPYLTERHKSFLEKVIILKPEKKIGIENNEIEGVYAEHSDPNTIGFKIYTPEVVIGYTSDTKLNQKTITQLKGSNILILNVVNPQGIDSEYNLNTTDAIEIISKCKPDLAVITHFGLKMLKSDPISEAREIHKATGVQIISATDGLSIAPASYSAKAKQKNLLDIR